MDVVWGTWKDSNCPVSLRDSRPDQIPLAGAELLPASEVGKLADKGGQTGPAPARSQPVPPPLTRGDIEVLRAKGYVNGQVAKVLGVFKTTPYRRLSEKY